MTDNVVGLDGKAVGSEPDYNTDVISLLERALADAKQYKATGVAVALVLPPKDDKDDFDIDVYWHGRRLTLLAAASRLSHHINGKCDEAMVVVCD